MRYNVSIGDCETVSAKATSQRSEVRLDIGNR